MVTLGQWAISLLLSHACPTPTAWVVMATITAVCGDEDGIPVYDARNKWAIPGNPQANSEDFESYNRAMKVLTP